MPGYLGNYIKFGYSAKYIQVVPLIRLKGGIISLIYDIIPGDELEHRVVEFDSAASYCDVNP